MTDDASRQANSKPDPLKALGELIHDMKKGVMRSRAEFLLRAMQEKGSIPESDIVKKFTQGMGMKSEEQRKAWTEQSLRNLNTYFKRHADKLGCRLDITSDGEGCVTLKTAPVEVAQPSGGDESSEQALRAATTGIQRVDRLLRILSEDVAAGLEQQYALIERLRVITEQRSDVILLGPPYVGVAKMNQLMKNASAVYQSTLSAPILREEGGKKRARRKMGEEEDTVFTQFHTNSCKLAHSGADFSYLFNLSDPERVRRVRDTLMVSTDERVSFSKPPRYRAAYYPHTVAPHPNFIIFRMSDNTWQMVEIFSGIKQGSSVPDPAYLKRNGSYIEDKLSFFNYQWGGGATEIANEQDLEKLVALSNDRQRDLAARTGDFYRRLSKTCALDADRRAKVCTSDEDHHLAAPEGFAEEELDLYIEHIGHLGPHDHTWTLVDRGDWSLEGSVIILKSASAVEGTSRRYLMDYPDTEDHKTSTPASASPGVDSCDT